ncbi:hypothetical protein SCLCIDRAFT_24969 [Scleroderma citrinum Foug A]|uniref:Uncharacterized protein n=1 Tax=Scleroderma citrinum Foug A TaxID=1036808 RepID=A0A0C3ABY2_9AGAM|nr:hypothetical protein SCLCIDRAFT_24969 [Scleroderma citrinum Foug A]
MLKQKKKQSRLDCLGESLSELHGELEMHMCKLRTKEERKRNELQGDPTDQSLGRLCKPKGRAGRADGYQIIDALGLSKKKCKYNRIVDNVRQLVYRYLDTSHSLAHQTNKLLVEKVIQKAQAGSDILMQCEGGWAVHDLIAQVLKNRSAAEQAHAKEARGKRKRDKDEEEEEEEERHIKCSKAQQYTQGSWKRRKRNEADKNEDEMDDGYETDHNDEGNKDNGHEDNKDVNRPKRLTLPRQGTAGTSQKKRKKIVESDIDDDDDCPKRLASPRQGMAGTSQKKRKKIVESDINDDDDRPERHTSPPQDMAGTSQKKRKKIVESDSEDDNHPERHTLPPQDTAGTSQKKRKGNKPVEESTGDGARSHTLANAPQTMETRGSVGNDAHTQTLVNAPQTTETQGSAGNDAHTQTLVNAPQTTETWGSAGNDACTQTLANAPQTTETQASVSDGARTQTLANMPQTTETQVSSAKEPAHGELHKKKRDNASLGQQDLTEAEEVDEEEVQSSLALAITQEEFPK